MNSKPGKNWKRNKKLFEICAGLENCRNKNKIIIDTANQPKKFEIGTP